MAIGELIGQLVDQGLTAPTPKGAVAEVNERDHENDVFAAERLLGDDETVLGEQLDSRTGVRRPVRSPSTLSDLLAPSRPDVEVPDEGQISTAGWDEEELGVEAWAWYRSFHWEPVDRWGIYLTDEGIWRLADRLRWEGGPSLSGLRTADLLRLATDVLLWHEYFHFLTDLAVSLAELADSSEPPGPLYVPHAKAVLAAGSHAGRPIEEALANAYAYRQVRPATVRPALKSVFSGQPNGYSAFGRFTGDAFVNGLQALLREATLHAGRTVAGAPPLELAFDVGRAYYSFADVPIRVVRKLEGTGYSLGFIESIERTSLIETKAFAKDLRRTPKHVRGKLDKALDRLVDTRSPGLSFKPLKRCGSVWSIRVGRDYRLALRHVPPKWELLRLLPRGRIYDAVCR